MAAILFRLGLLAVGMGTLEVGIGDGLAHGSVAGWALALLVGLPLIVAGSAGFMVPLLRGTTKKGSTDA